MDSARIRSRSEDGARASVNAPQVWQSLFVNTWRELLIDFLLGDLILGDMEQTSPILNENVETLSSWRLCKADTPFSDEEFLQGLEEHVKEANKLFDRAISELATATE